MLNIFGRKNKNEQDAPSHPEVKAAEENIDTDVFEYVDSEKERVEEWWLQKGVEEEIEEEPEPEELEEDQEEGESEGSGGDENDLIYSLKEEEDEEDDMASPLRNAIEELGDMTAEELLDLGMTALEELNERMTERS